MSNTRDWGAGRSLVTQMETTDSPDSTQNSEPTRNAEPTQGREPDSRGVVTAHTGGYAEVNTIRGGVKMTSSSDGSSRPTPVTTLAENVKTYYGHDGDVVIANTIEGGLVMSHTHGKPSGNPAP